MGYETYYSGDATFECRNKEEAVLLAYLINKYFEQLNVFPLREVYDLKNYKEDYIKTDGIYATVFEEKDKALLKINAESSSPVRNDDGYGSILFFPLYFLSKQTKLKDCYFVMEGQNFGDLKFFVKSEKQDEISYIKYDAESYYCYNDSQGLSMYSLILKYEDFFKPVSDIIKGPPKSFVDFEITVEANDGIRTYNADVIFEKLFDLLFNQMDISFKLRDTNSVFKDYKEWKNKIDEFVVNHIDIENLLTNDNFYDDFNDCQDELLKIQAVFNCLINALIESEFIDEKLEFYCNYEDSFLNNKDYYCVFNFRFGPKYFTLDLEYGKHISDFYLDEYFEFHYQPPKGEDIISHFTKYLSYISMKKSALSFSNLSLFSGDFYEYCKTKPKVKMEEDIYLPLDLYFVPLFFDEFEGKLLVDKGNDTYHLVNQNDKNTNLYPTLCGLCKHRIRKMTMGCNNCNFSLLT